jgi:hypothetical protein
MTNAYGELVVLEARAIFNSALGYNEHDGPEAWQEHELTAWPFYLLGYLNGRAEEIYQSGRTAADPSIAARKIESLHAALNTYCGANA